MFASGLLDLGYGRKLPQAGEYMYHVRIEILFKNDEKVEREKYRHIIPRAG